MSESSPHAPAGRRAGRPPRISRADVVAGALHIADTEGIDALSLRSVADRLAVTPAALYRLVSGAPDLVAIVIEAALDQATDGVSVPAGWRAALDVSARLLHSVLVEHPMLVEAYQRRLVVSARARELIETVLDALLDAGLAEQAAVEVYATVQAYVVGYVALEHRRSRLVARSGTRWAAEVTSNRSLARRFARDYFSPAGFETGLTAVLDGIAVRIDGPPRNRPPGRQIATRPPVPAP
ncbi:MAG: TetR/AcrR family transcriptional regulator [Mycobacteriales bacterium]